MISNQKTIVNYGIFSKEHAIKFDLYVNHGWYLLFECDSIFRVESQVILVIKHVEIFEGNGRIDWLIVFPGASAVQRSC